jgi:hypothetical protein
VTGDPGNTVSLDGAKSVGREVNGDVATFKVMVIRCQDLPDSA